MSDTFTQIYAQLVFVVKNQEPLIDSVREEMLYRFLGDEIVKHGHRLIIMGGTASHVHILLQLNPSNAISDLVRDIKSQSSYRINHNSQHRSDFHWQQGYFAYSYTRSQVNLVYKFIENQKSYHAQKLYREEYVDMEALDEQDEVNESMFKYKYQ